MRERDIGRLDRQPSDICKRSMDGVGISKHVIISPPSLSLEEMGLDSGGASGPDRGEKDLPTIRGRGPPPHQSLPPSFFSDFVVLVSTRVVRLPMCRMAQTGDLPGSFAPELDILAPSGTGRELIHGPRPTVRGNGGAGSPHLGSLGASWLHLVGSCKMKIERTSLPSSSLTNLFRAQAMSGCVGTAQNSEGGGICQPKSWTSTNFSGIANPPGGRVLDSAATIIHAPMQSMTFILTVSACHGLRLFVLDSQMCVPPVACTLCPLHLILRVSRAVEWTSEDEFTDH